MPSFDEMKSTVDTVKVKTAAAEKSLSEHDCKITLLNYKSVDLEARSRCNNLIFRSLYKCCKEDCVLVLKQFFEVDLSLNPDDIVIERAHRLGRKRNRFSKRPIIAAFNNSE